MFEQLVVLRAQRTQRRAVLEHELSELLQPEMRQVRMRVCDEVLVEPPRLFQLDFVLSSSTKDKVGSKEGCQRRGGGEGSRAGVISSSTAPFAVKEIHSCVIPRNYLLAFLTDACDVSSRQRKKKHDSEGITRFLSHSPSHRPRTRNETR